MAINAGAKSVADTEQTIGPAPEDDPNLVRVYDLLGILKADGLDPTVQRDLSGFSPTQKITLRKELRSMVAAEEALEIKLTASSTSGGIWARLSSIVHGVGRRDFMKKDEDARAHAKRARYFRVLLDQVQA